jgi:hypothetical protein
MYLLNAKEAFDITAVPGQLGRAGGWSREGKQEHSSKGGD